MQSITTTLTKQAARTVASRTIRTVAKQHIPTNSLIYKVGVAALIAGIGHLITKGIQTSSQSPLLEDGFDSPPPEIKLSEKEIAEILHQRMLPKNK